MKNYLNLFTLFFTCFVFSQAQITYTSVRLTDGTESSYLELEEFWAEIQENLIKDDYASFWAIWKVEQDSEKENQSDYLIMNIWKDSIQKAKSMQINKDEKEFIEKNIEEFQNNELKKSLLNLGNKITIEDK